MQNRPVVDKKREISMEIFRAFNVGADHKNSGMIFKQLREEPGRSGPMQSDIILCHGNIIGVLQLLGKL